MTLTAWTKVVATIVVISAGVAIGFAWRAEIRNQAKLAAELASTKQALADADARQRQRDEKLADTLAAITAQKRTVQSPAQIVAELPKQMGLPAPITLQSVHEPGGAGAHSRTTPPPALHLPLGSQAKIPPIWMLPKSRE